MSVMQVLGTQSRWRVNSAETGDMNLKTLKYCTLFKLDKQFIQNALEVINCHARCIIAHFYRSINTPLHPKTYVISAP